MFSQWYQAEFVCTRLVKEDEPCVHRVLHASFVVRDLVDSNKPSSKEWKFGYLLLQAVSDTVNFIGFFYAREESPSVKDRVNLLRLIPVFWRGGGFSPPLLLQNFSQVT